MWESYPHDTPDVLRIQQQSSDGIWETVMTEKTGDTAGVDPWADSRTDDARAAEWHLAEDRALTRLGITRDVVAWQ